VARASGPIIADCLGKGNIVPTNHTQALISPVIRVSYANEGLDLHQPQDICWAIRGSAPPLACVEMTSWSSRLCPGFWWQEIWNKLFAGVILLRLKCALAKNFGFHVASSRCPWSVQTIGAGMRTAWLAFGRELLHYSRQGTRKACTATELAVK
jgi:hypothetical protein